MTDTLQRALILRDRLVMRMTGCDCGRLACTLDTLTGCSIRRVCDAHDRIITGGRR